MTVEELAQKWRRLIAKNEHLELLQDEAHKLKQCGRTIDAVEAWKKIAVILMAQNREHRSLNHETRDFVRGLGDNITVATKDAVDAVIALMKRGMEKHVAHTEQLTKSYEH